MTKHSAASDQISEVMFYTRPGCPYCTSLRWRLRRSGLPFREVDIWANPSAAALVRTLTGGDETVPTVVVGTAAAVNPGLGQVQAMVEEHAPHLARTAAATQSSRGGFRSLARRITALAGSKSGPDDARP